MSAGRKLEFDRSEALEAAMLVFWKKGYVGASLSDLTKGMGINKPSLYATYGNKEALFLQATDYYLDSIANQHNRFLEEEGVSLKERLANYMASVIAGQCDLSKPKGCYISLSVSEAEGDELPAKAVQKVRDVSVFAVDKLEQLFSNDSEAMAVGLNDEAKTNAQFVMSVLNGTSAMARGGATLEQLTPLIAKVIKGLGV